MNNEISDIFIISLDSRPERWNRFSSQINLWEEAFGVTPKRFRAVYGIELETFGEKPWFADRMSEKRKRSWGGKAGCILSHRNVIEAAHDRNLNNVLIVEDDAYLPKNFPESWVDSFRQLTSDLPEDWAALYFCTTKAFSPCRIVKQKEDVKLVESSGALGAVCYLINGKIFKNLLEELPIEKTIWSWVARHKTIDRWLSQNLMRFGKVYLFVPSLAGHHSVGSSDTSMTAENDHELDFSLKDIVFTNNQKVFRILKTCRSAINFTKRKTSFFRKAYKKKYGL